MIERPVTRPDLRHFPSNSRAAMLEVRAYFNVPGWLVGSKPYDRHRGKPSAKTRNIDAGHRSDGSHTDGTCHTTSANQPSGSVNRKKRRAPEDRTLPSEAPAVISRDRTVSNASSLDARNEQWSNRDTPKKTAPGGDRSSGAGRVSTSTAWSVIPSARGISTIRRPSPPVRGNPVIGSRSKLSR